MIEFRMRYILISLILFGIFISDSGKAQSIDIDGFLEVAWNAPAYGDPVDHYIWSYTINGVKDSVTGTSSNAILTDNSVQLINLGDWAIFSVQAISVSSDTSTASVSDTVYYLLSDGGNPGGQDLPSSFEVHAYPNPVVQSEFYLSLNINKDDNYDVVIYDILGRKVKTVLNRQLTVGEYEEVIQKDFATGIYFAVIANSGSHRVVKLSIIR